jgi:hypothetical protein
MSRSHSRAVAWPEVRVLALLVLVGSMVAPIAGGGDGPRLSSEWRADPIRIDGNDDEWRGRTAPFEKQRFALGLQNDGEALYLCLTTRDRVLSTQIARQGLMVWIDPGPDRPKKHVFGVHFPIDPRLAAMRAANGRWPRDGGDVNDTTQAAIGILGGRGRDTARVPLTESGGIEGSAKFHGDVLVYELKIPLKGGTGPYQVSAGPGDTVNLELQTPEWRGPLPPSRGPIGFTAAGSAPEGRGVVGYPSVDATYLKPTDVRASVRLSAAR